jgi:hypothetical protein
MQAKVSFHYMQVDNEIYIYIYIMIHHYIHVLRGSSTVTRFYKYYSDRTEVESRSVFMLYVTAQEFLTLYSCIATVQSDSPL